MHKTGIRGIQDTRHMVTGKTDQVQNNGKNQSGRKSSSLAIRQLRIGLKAIRQKGNSKVEINLQIRRTAVQCTLYSERSCNLLIP